MMVKTLIGLKVASSMFAMGMAVGMGIMGLCKYAKNGTGVKSAPYNSNDSREDTAAET